MIIVAVVMLAAAIAVCVEGFAWVRSTHRHLDESQERLRTLLAQFDASEDG